MSEKCGCSCDCGDSSPKIIYACSGAANVGFLADNVSRKLVNDSCGKMSCLAAVGAGLSGFVESAKVTDNVVIDGCPVACGKKIFENNSLPYTHVILTEMGVEKGKTEITKELITKVTEDVKGKIA